MSGHIETIMGGEPHNGHASVASTHGAGHDRRWDDRPPDPQRTLQWLRAYESRITSGAARLAAGQCRRLGVPFNPRANRMWYAARDVWLGASAPVSAYVHRASRLALLDAASLRPVLAARSIYPSRGALRRIVSGKQRHVLANALGEPTFVALTEMGLNALSANVPVPEDATADTLVAAGRLLFERDEAWPLAPARRLIGLALDDNPGESDTPAQGPVLEAASNCLERGPTDDSEAFLSDAGKLFPELTWLFG